MTKRSGNPLIPRWLWALAGLIDVCVLLPYAIWADINVEGYDGYPTIFILASFGAGIFGVHRGLRRGETEGDDQP